MDNNFPTLKDLKNIGVRNMANDALGTICRFMLTPETFSFDTEEDAMDIENWIELTASPIVKRGFVSPMLGPEAPARTNDGTKYHEGVLGTIFIRDGKISYEATIPALSVSVFKKMRTLSNKTWRVFFFDTKRNVWGVKKGEIVTGFLLNNFNIEDYEETDSEGQANLVRLKFSISDTKEFLDDRLIMKPYDKDEDSWNPLTDITSLEDVILSEGVGGTTSVLAINTIVDGTTDVGVPGFTTADFILTKTATPTVPIALTATDNGDGTYSLAITSSPLEGGNYTLRLADPLALTVYGFECKTPYVFQVAN